MPDRSKIRWSQLKVGIVAGSGFIILFALVFLLTSSRGFFQNYVLLRTYMDDASGLAEGTTVRLNGIAIGYLGNLRLTQSRVANRTVEFDMMVKNQYLPEIPVDSVASISAANLLGDKFLNIIRGTSTRHVEPGATLPSQQAQDIPELMAQSAKLLQSFQGIVTRVDNLLVGVEAGKGNLGKFVKDEELYNRLNGIAAEGQKLLTDIRTGGGTISKLISDPALYDEMHGSINRVNSILADLQAGQGTAGKLLKDPSLFNEAEKSLAEIRALLADVNAGKGTAGKLVKDEQLYNRINVLVARFNTTMSKIESGQGTLGQLAVNPQLYDSLRGMTNEFQALAKDIRANPKKFLSIRLTLF